MIKHTLLLTLALLSCCNIVNAQTTVSEMYIIPVDAYGNPSFDGEDFTDKITMTAAPDGTFSVTGCDIEYGFYFLGQSDKTGSLYSLNSWAVNPPVQIGPNPAIITTSSSKNYIRVSSGSYDIKFIQRSISGEGFHTFTISATDEETEYPSEIYLITDTSPSQCIAVSGKNGIYNYDYSQGLSAFKISYEPSGDYTSFIYGPINATDASLTLDRETWVALGKNTDTSFEYTVIAREDPFSAPPLILTISVVPDNQYVLLHEDDISGITGIDKDEACTHAEFYTISGTQINEKDLTPGIYIKKQGNHTSKHIIR
ncbi:MAG: hypothetical protein NC405_04050 [Odoribacter sp.]|nr:hypothetical protein [Odoribacter sp.]